jgi:transcriptional regulator with XRE-family HTH domain
MSLKDNLVQKMSFGLKRSDLAKKSGISEEMLYRIITGKINSPGIIAIEKIADALSVSIDELVGREDFFNKYILTYKDSLVLETSLFIEILLFVGQFLQNYQDLNIKVPNALYVIRSICDYSIKNNQGKLDLNFAKWIINNNLISEKQPYS